MNNELLNIIGKAEIALQEAIADAENSKKNAYDGFDGQLLLTGASERIYQFTLKTSWDIKEHTQVFVILDGKYRADARVVSSQAHILMLATRDVLPRERLSHVKLVENIVWLLKKQLQAVTNLRETTTEFGAKTLGLLPVKSGSRAVQRKLSQFTLHPNQEKAIAHALGSEKTLIVGPPGTGKTATISLLTCYYLLLGFSVLLVAPTNNATDNAFMRLIDVVRASDQADLHALIEQGLVIRAGTPHHAALRRGTYREFTVNGMVDAQMSNKREQLEQEQYKVDQRIQNLEDRLSQKVQAWLPGRDALRKDQEILEEKVLYGHLDEPHVNQREDQTSNELWEQITSLKQEWYRINAQIEDLDVQQGPPKKQIMVRAQLVATTATGSYLNTSLLERPFDVVVADEISMISLIEILLVASHATKRFVGAGDPMQLAPIVTLEHKNKAPHAQEWLGKNLFAYLNVSIFDAIDGMKECVLLTQQGRCNPKIIAPINYFSYQGILTNREETWHTPGIGPHPEWPLMLVDTTNSGAMCLKPSRRQPRENEYHARLAVDLAQQVLESLPPRPPGDDPTIPRVAIIVPYRSQLNLIRQKLRKAGIADRVYVYTVNTVQSLQFEVVIFDTVEAPGVIPCKFIFDRLRDEHRMATDATRKLTVAWTRACHKLIVIAHRKHLHDYLPPDTGGDSTKRQRLLYDLVEWASREGYITSEEVFASFAEERS